MHRLKKVTLEVTLGLVMSLSAFAADDDGTFTITIQGPEVEDTAPATRPQARQTPRRSTVTPRQTPAVTVTPRQNTAASQGAVAVPVQQTPAAASAVPDDQFRTYNVVTGDTIWSVAHRYAQLNRSINEFQVVASIYRYNPQAFAGGNVNNLMRTTLRIPPDSVIAQENTQTGSSLLSQGSMNLPPLPVVQNTVPQTAQRATAQSTPAQSTVPAAQSGTAANKPANDIPVYTATETRIKEVQKQREAEENGELIPSSASNKDSQNPNERRNLAQNGTQLEVLNEAEAANNPEGANANPQIQNQGFTPEQMKQIQALLKQNPQEAVDVKSIRIMLEENKKQIDQKTKVIEQQFADAIARMKKSSAVTAQTAADSVSSLSSQYDNIIAGIQQDLIEIKGNVSKLSQDNDRMREMLLANDEKIEDMQLQMSQFTVSSVDASIDMDKPVMMILFGAGLLSLVILILFIIFKARARARSRKYHDDFDFDDASSLGSDDMLLSDDNGSIELETHAPEGDDVADEPPADEAVAPEGGDAAAAPADGAPAENKDEAAPAAEASDESKAQEEWDKAAEESSEGSSDDQNVLDEWSKALNEDQQSGEKETEVEGKSDDASVADEWAAALGEQENAEKAQDAPEEPKKDEQEDMAAAWAAALGEQEGGGEEKPAEEAAPAEESSSSGEQEDMAAAWAAALGEQEGAPAEEAAETPAAEEKAPAKEEPAKPAEAKKAEAPAEEAVSEDVNVEDIAAEAPAEEAVSEDVNVEDIAAEAPVEEAVSEDVSVEAIAAETPAEEAVSEDISVDETEAVADPAEQEIDVGDLVQNEGTEETPSTDEVSGEESALADAMENAAQGEATPDAEAEVVEEHSDETSKVDEVVDDEIDLEVLLRPVTQDAESDLIQNENPDEVQPEETAVENTETPAEEIAEAPAEESAEAAAQEPVEAAQEDVVSWEVPQDEYDVVSSNTQDDSVEDAAAALAQLEARINSAAHYVDPQAESELMNMLGDGVSADTGELPQGDESAFSPEEISRMINGDSSQSDVPELQQVSNTIGPISANADLSDQAALAENLSEGEKEILSPKEHQYYVDELNLARLYFETGDTEEAIKIIADVQEHGSLDLKKEASKVMEAYGS